MDKYFARISSLSINKELPMRIRFMLLDVIDLRDNNVSIKTCTSIQFSITTASPH